MNIASILVLAGLFAFVGFALWRNFKKGAPCSCGCSRKECGCRCGEDRDGSAGSCHHDTGSEKM